MGWAQGEENLGKSFFALQYITLLEAFHESNFYKS
jgi:hypothetical protein